MNKTVKVLTVSGVFVGMIGGVVFARPWHTVTNGFDWRAKFWWDDATTTVKSIDGLTKVKRRINVVAKRYEDNGNNIDQSSSSVYTEHRDGSWGDPIISVTNNKKTSKDPERSYHYTCVEDGVERGETSVRISGDNFNYNHYYTFTYK